MVPLRHLSELKDSVLSQLCLDYNVPKSVGEAPEARKLMFHQTEELDSVFGEIETK